MKRKVFKTAKKLVAGIATVAMIATGILVVPTEVDAAGPEMSINDGVIYKEVTDRNVFEKHYSEKTAPTCSDSEYGYLFGGWYTHNGNEYVAVTEGTEVSTIEKVYAKFVPAYVMSVKCQNHSQTKAGDSSTSMRIYTSIDSLSYKEVGFNVTEVMLDAYGTYESQENIGDGKYVVDTVYKGLYVYDTAGNKKSYDSENIFGLKGDYLAGTTIKNIDDFSAIICIQPYWKTKDGTIVNGLTKYAHVEDGLNGYINVPINLKNSFDVAAGVLSIDYSSTGLQLVSVEGVNTVEGGRVFEEMAYSAGNAGVVKCVGNMEKISDDDKKSDDIYINLRFQAPEGGKEYDGRFYHFTVGSEDFCNNAEEKPTTYNVWNIQY